MNDQRKYYEEKEIHRKEGKKKMRGKEKAKRFITGILDDLHKFIHERSRSYHHRWLQEQ